jgi:hypothetical protein
MVVVDNLEAQVKSEKLKKKVVGLVNKVFSEDIFQILLCLQVKSGMEPYPAI